MSTKYGIDLGTTYSAISYYSTDEQRSVCAEFNKLVQRGDRRLVPSVVMYEEGGGIKVGEGVINKKFRQPERVIELIKRRMGSDYKTNPIDGVEYTPQQVSAALLKAIVEDAEQLQAEKIVDVVITVPAYFGDAERAATEEAARQAGLNLLQLVSEPQAAVLAFAKERANDLVDKHVLVYDLGGGTFDVVLTEVSVENKDAEVPALNVKTLELAGNRELGGADWNRKLKELVIERVQEEYDISVGTDARGDAWLDEQCEQAKRALGQSDRVEIEGAMAAHSVEVTLADFEECTAALLDETEVKLNEVLEAAKKNHNIDRDKITTLLVGGSTRMPMVKDMLGRVMGKPPLSFDNPELLVAQGAGLWAHLAGGGTVAVPTTDADGNRTKVETKKGGLTTMSAEAYGIEGVRPSGEIFNDVILKSGASFGTIERRRYAVSEDGMTEIDLKLYKGDSPNTSECSLLATATISGLPPGRPAGQPVEVILELDQSGIIRGTAKDLNTGKDCKIELDRSQAGAK